MQYFNLQSAYQCQISLQTNFWGGIVIFELKREPEYQVYVAYICLLADTMVKVKNHGENLANQFQVNVSFLFPLKTLRNWSEMD